MIIAIEGADGSGKTSVIEGLKKQRAIFGSFFKYRVFPYLKEEKKAIFEDYLKAFNDIEAEKLRNLLFLQDFLHFDRTHDRSHGYITDRSLLSTFLYTEHAKNRIQVADFIRSFNIQLPDLIFILDVDPEVARRRKSSRRNDRSFRSPLEEEKVIDRYRNYRNYANFQPFLEMDRDGKIFTVSGSLSLEDQIFAIASQIRDASFRLFY